MHSSFKTQVRNVSFSLICAWTNGWVNYLDADDLRRHRARYNVIVMDMLIWISPCAVKYTHMHIYTYIANKSSMFYPKTFPLSFAIQVEKWII